MFHHVFVYGTLKSNHGNHRLVQDAVSLGVFRSTITFVLTESGIPYLSEELVQHYPDMAGYVEGEMYVVNDQQLARLDQLEGHPRWYVRHERLFVNEANQFHTAWVYLNDTKAANFVVPDEKNILRF